MDVSNSHSLDEYDKFAFGSSVHLPSALSVEGWYHRLNSNIVSTNPNFYQVIDDLKRDYAFNMATIKQIGNKTSKAPRSRKFVHRNQRIMDLTDRYEGGSLSLSDHFDEISKTIGKKSQ